jgi:hypothetical protein
MVVDFVREPSRENYLRLWEAVTSGPSYAPYTDPLEPVEQLLKSKDFAGAQDALRPLLGQLVLCPRAHLLASVAAKGAGDQDLAGFESMFYVRCIEGILATGDGTADQPYLVTRTSDEYDVLWHLEKELQMQSLMHGPDGRSLDRMACRDGSELHFDVTRVLASLNLGNPTGHESGS